MAFKTLDDVVVHGKRVLVREDLNVPMKDGAVADLTRIDAALPTITRLSRAGARVILLSHLGRPDGKRNDTFSLRPIAEALSERLGFPVMFIHDCIGTVAHVAVREMNDGAVILLENVRFHEGEEQNNPVFAAELAILGDIFVNDAFGTAHRAHASTEGIAHLLPSYAGPLMAAELSALGSLLTSPEKPYVCVIGGAKVKDKVGVFTNLIERVDAFCIGGGMANTFLAAQGIDVGKSLRDEDLAPAKSILALAHERGVELHLPTDAVVAPSFDADSASHVVALADIGTEMILDIGPATSGAYARVIEKAKTIVFNGPMGVYEKASYREGTRVVGAAIARATTLGARTVVGGGDAAAAAQMLGFASKVSHVSTGGGATLEFLEGATLPGVAALG